jgi:hypothetical protein
MRATKARTKEMAIKQIKKRLMRRSGRFTSSKRLRDKDRMVSAMGGYLTGGQAKLDKNKNNKIDAQDFKILRAEKAKGRGKGLQDEKMKPGKVMKALGGGMMRGFSGSVSGGVSGSASKKETKPSVGSNMATDKIKKDKIKQITGIRKGKMIKVKKAVVGMLAMGLGAKKNMDKRKAPMAMGAAGLATAKLGLMKKVLGIKKGSMIKAKEGKSILGGANRPTKIKLTGFGSVLGGKGGPAGRNAETYKKYLKGLKKATAKKSMRTLGREITKGGLEAAKATRIGKIAAGIAGAALLAKAGLEKMYEKRTGKKPFTKREKQRTLVDKKMGGGMMMKKPMMMSGGLTEATQKLKAQGKMGGGMMQRPMMAMGGGMMPGYKKGKSVMAKGCKLGRKKPTKMYT